MGEFQTKSLMEEDTPKFADCTLSKAKCIVGIVS
jgi:hypothetical protein